MGLSLLNNGKAHWISLLNDQATFGINFFEEIDHTFYSPFFLLKKGYYSFESMF